MSPGSFVQAGTSTALRPCPPTHLPGSTRGSFPDLHPTDPSVITEGMFLSKAITTSSQHLSLQEPFEQSLLRNRLKNYIFLQ